MRFEKRRLATLSFFFTAVQNSRFSFRQMTNSIHIAFETLRDMPQKCSDFVRHVRRCATHVTSQDILRHREMFQDVKCRLKDFVVSNPGVIDEEQTEGLCRTSS